MRRNEPEITDAERLDAMEYYVSREPLVVWNGVGKFEGGRLNGLGIEGRGLRGALDVLVEARRILFEISAKGLDCRATSAKITEGIR